MTNEMQDEQGVANNKRNYMLPSDFALDKGKVKDLVDLLLQMQPEYTLDNLVNSGYNFTLLMGAGCSAGSGIPTGAGIIQRIQFEISPESISQTMQPKTTITFIKEIMLGSVKSSHIVIQSNRSLESNLKAIGKVLEKYGANAMS